MNNGIKLGLKGQFSYAIHNYSSIRAILRHMKWELKYAWQRAWNGYDSVDIFNFNTSFRDRMIICLEQLDKTRHSLFNVPEKYGDNYIEDIVVNNRIYFSDEETSKIIHAIIDYLKMSDEDYVEKQLYGKNIYDDDYEYNRTQEELINIENVRKKNQDMAFDLLKMFWDQLWD